MGLLLQKPNIICGDVDQQRYFLPREILGKEEYGFKEMKDLMSLWLWNKRWGAEWDGTVCVEACLILVRSRRRWTLQLCFMNPAMFQTKIRDRKSVV